MNIVGLIVGSHFLFLCLLLCPFFSSVTYSLDLRNEVLKQIAVDLDPYKDSGIRSADLDLLFEAEKKANSSLLVKFTIKNNTLTIANPSKNCRALPIVKAIHAILRRTKLPNMTFLATMHDYLDNNKFSVPIFSFAKLKTTPHIILIPDFEALSGNYPFFQELEQGKARFPWHVKKDQIFWRGNTTGGLFTAQNFLNFPRSRAVCLSFKYPHLINARYTDLCQCSDREYIKKTYSHFFSNLVAVKEHLLYKYQLLIDGNSCAYSRAYWQLFSECVLFKQSSSSIQWYYRGLQPFVHYIPLQADLNDLPQWILWAQKHDKECRQIADRAHAFARKNLSHEQVLEYLHLLLIEYAKLQR